MLNFKLVEISLLARRVLIQLYQDDAHAQSKGRRATMLTASPQNELEILLMLTLVERTMIASPMGQLYCYSISSVGISYAFSQLQQMSQ